MDYSQIITVALLIISEILPLINQIPSNGILHTIKLTLAYLWIKFCNQSELAREVEYIKNKEAVIDEQPKKFTSAIMLEE
jgi:hypothetical protein